MDHNQVQKPAVQIRTTTGAPNPNEETTNEEEHAQNVPTPFKSGGLRRSPVNSVPQPTLRLTTPTLTTEGADPTTPLRAQDKATASKRKATTPQEGEMQRPRPIENSPTTSGQLYRTLEDRIFNKIEALQALVLKNTTVPMKTAIDELATNSRAMKREVPQAFMRMREEIANIRAEMATMERYLSQQEQQNQAAEAEKKRSADLEAQIKLLRAENEELRAAQFKDAEATKEDFYKRIATCDSAETVTALAAEVWPRDVYKKTTASKTSILADRRVRVIVVEAEAEKDASILRNLESQFPAAKGLLERISAFQVAAAEYKGSVAVEGEDQPTEDEARKLVVCKIPTKEDNNEAPTLEWFWKAITKVMAYVNREDAPNDVAIVPPTGIRSDAARKLIEIATANLANIDRVDVCTRWSKKPEPTKEEVAAKRLHRRGEDTRRAVTIKSTDGQQRTFADMARALKKSVAPKETGVNVEKIIKLPSGDIRLLVKETLRGGADTLAKAIKEKAGVQAEVSQRGDTMAIIVRDLDEATTAEELRQSLENVRGVQARGPDIQIGKPRPNADGNWYTKVTLPKRDGALVVAKKRLCVGAEGWAINRVAEWVQPESCRNCQCFGHRTQDCREEKKDRPRCCFRCGSADHAAKACKSDKPNCYNCGKEHAANSMACPMFRDSVHKAKANKAPKRRTGTTSNVAAPDGGPSNSDDNQRWSTVTKKRQRQRTPNDQANVPTSNSYSELQHTEEDTEQEDDNDTDHQHEQVARSAN